MEKLLPHDMETEDIIAPSEPSRVHRLLPSWREEIGSFNSSVALLKMPSALHRGRFWSFSLARVDSECVPAACKLTLYPLSCALIH